MACEVWRDVEASLIGEMKAMPEENRRLKRMYADVSMQNDLLKGKSRMATYRVSA